MGIYESLMRNRENIDNIAGVVQRYYQKQRDEANRANQKQRDEANRAKMSGIFAPKREASGTTDFSIDSGEDFKPLKFRDVPKRNLSMEDIMELGEMVKESPGLEPTAKLLQERMQGMRPRRKYINQEGGALDVITEYPETDDYTVEREIGMQERPEREDNKKWVYGRDNKIYYRIPIDGDRPYEKSERESGRGSGETERITKEKTAKEELRRIKVENMKLGVENTDLGRGIIGGKNVYEPESWKEGNQYYDWAKLRREKNDKKIAENKKREEQLRREMGWWKEEDEEDEVGVEGGTFTVEEVRRAYPELTKGKTNAQIIESYKNQGIIVNE